MNFENIRHLREIVVTDPRGKTSRIMQYSSQNVSHFRPTFVPVPCKDQTRARERYVKSGGRRREGSRIGTTVVIANP